MKPILKRENKDVILTSKITSIHIVVGLNLDNNPVILTTERYGIEKYKLTLMNKGFTLNNGYGYGSFKSIQKIVEYYVEKGWKLEVFHEDDWKKALQWLIDNAE